MATPKTIPTILVKTWIEILVTSENPEAIERATSNLINVFGDIKTATEFVENSELDFA